MAKATPWDKYAFNAAWIIAAVLALGFAAGQAWTTEAWWTLLLVVLGLVVGFTYNAKDVSALILVAVALAIFGGSSLAAIPYVGAIVSDAVGHFLTFLTPAALVVALKKVYIIMK